MGKAKNSKRKRGKKQRASDASPLGTSTADFEDALAESFDLTIDKELLQKLKHPKASERETACLVVVKTFEECTTKDALHLLRRYQVSSVLGALLERLGDGIPAIKLLTAGAFRNIASFEDPRIHDILIQANVVNAIDNLLQQVKHFLPAMSARVAGLSAEGEKQTIEHCFYAELLSVVLNLCQYSQSVVSQVTRSTQIPNVIFQILIHPGTAVEGNAYPPFPYLNLDVCLRSAVLLHTLTEENVELNKQIREGNNGFLAQGIMKIIDSTSRALLSPGGVFRQDLILKIHWHLLGVLGNLCSNTEDFANILDKATHIFYQTIGDIVPNGEPGLGQRVQEVVQVAMAEKENMYKAAREQRREPTDEEIARGKEAFATCVNTFILRISSLNVGMEILSYLFTTIFSAYGGQENSISLKIRAYDAIAKRLGTFACTNPYASWNPDLVEDQDLRASLVQMNIDFSTHAANCFNAWMQHFHPSGGSTDAFASAWLNFCTAGSTSMALKSKHQASTENLTVALMGAAERTCAQFVENGVPPQLHSVGWLDMAYRVISSCDAPAEARSSALRLMAHHALSHPSNHALYENVGNLLNELLLGCHSLPLLVFADALDVTFDLFGDEAHDGVYVSSMLRDTLPRLLQQGLLDTKFKSGKEDLDEDACQHVVDTLTNLSGFCQYKNENCVV
jgi:hypothetical protein